MNASEAKHTVHEQVNYQTIHHFKTSMKLNMSFDEWYKELVKMMTQDGFTAPSRQEVQRSYEAGKSPYEIAQQYALSQTKWDEQEGDDPFID